MFLSLILVTIAVPLVAESDYIPDPLATLDNKQEMQEWVKLETTKYGISEKMFTAVIRCESSFNPTVYGDGGRAYGLLQFHEPTFLSFAKQYEKKTGQLLNYESPKDQITLGAWAFSMGYQSHWTCYDKVTKLP